MSEHLGYDKHDPAGRYRGNSRNGIRAKTVLTEVGPVQIEVPRDLDGRPLRMASRDHAVGTFSVTWSAASMRLRAASSWPSRHLA